MDKRTVLALVLVALVVILTPKLFPTSTPHSTPGATQRADSIAEARADISGARDLVVIEDTITSGAVMKVPPAAVVTETVNVNIVRAESTVVSADSAQYVFSNIGAVPVEVKLPGFRALDKVHESVSVSAGAQSLIGYRVLGVSDTISLAKVAFEVERSSTTTGATVLAYRGRAGGRSIELKYTIVTDSFVSRVEGVIGNDMAGKPARYVLIDLPTTFRSFEADSADDQNHFAFAMKPRTRNAEGIPFQSLDPGERMVVSGPLTWAAAKSKYFIVGVLAPEGDESFAEGVAVGSPRVSRTATTANGTVVARLGNDGAFRFDLFTGPQQYKRLQSMGREFENSNPYGGWLQGVVQPFATLVMRILLWMKATLKLDYGWLLVIFGIAVRLILWPLNHGAMRTSMKMQRIQPELNDIQKRYKADPQKMQSEMMRVYKEHDMSPFSTFAGCLPLLLPMPVLFALFFVFQNTIEFRGVPFLWLADISIKDPYYIVPLLMGVSMFVLSWVGMRNAPPNPQAKMMLYIFPVMMTFLFANFASGLNLYYAIQNVAAIPQQWLIANERGKSGGGGVKKT